MKAVKGKERLKMNLKLDCRAAAQWRIRLIAGPPVPWPGSLI